MAAALLPQWLPLLAEPPQAQAQDGGPGGATACPAPSALRLLASGAPEYAALVALAAVGFLALLRLASRALRAIWVLLLRPGCDPRAYGKWAVVTGATDGIGHGFARELARRGMAVVLVSRSQDRLDAVANELSSKYGTETRTVAVDLAAADVEAQLAVVGDALAGLEVGVLVNNVGLSYPHAQYFHELSSELITALIRVNVEVTTRLTHLVLTAMLKRRRGAIVNIGSGAASVLPSDPLYAVYAGTKGYIDQFSRTLYVEYKHNGIDVQCQAPLFVATKLSKIRHASVTCPSADAYARAGVRLIGYEPRCTPYWAHSLMWALIAALPEPVVDTLRLRQSSTIRRRALAKEATKKQM
eukprot:SM000056S17937  [mRNA]  locus=s56:254885:256399:+ [translate_table: standard]